MKSTEFAQVFTRAALAEMFTRAALAATVFVAVPSLLRAQPGVFYPDKVTIVPEGTIITPGSSQFGPEDEGFVMHTNVELFQPKNHPHLYNSSPSGKFENPASLACVYGVTPMVTGCNPETLTTVATGGSRAIAIVDAFDDPNVMSDLNVYSAQYGLPAITADNFQVVYATGTQPAQDPTGGWEVEESLDVDMAHALAPNAKIIFVEAASNSGADLIMAEKVAAKMVEAAGGGEVSNSWGGHEFKGEERFEQFFAKPRVVFFASAGDHPGTEFPSVMSRVVSVGGTVIQRSSEGDYMAEVSWPATGGGKSKVVKTPAYQSVIASIVGHRRGVPDISLDASPVSGVWIYDTIPSHGTVLKWTTVGGTSVASPASAALVNNAGHFNKTSIAELTEIYANYGDAEDFRDITAGVCNNGGETMAVVGWDFCTGVGSLFGTGGK
jgi:subtilase family serine protease